MPRTLLAQAKAKVSLSLLLALTIIGLGGIGLLSLSRLRVVAAAGAAAGTGAGPQAPAPAPHRPAATPPTREALGAVPLSFEPNRGQAAAGAKYLSRGTGYQLTLTASEAVLQLHPRATLSAVTPLADTLPAAHGEQPALFKTARPAHAQQDAAGRAVELGMKLLGANPSPQIEAERELAGRSNYLVGNDPAQWHTDVPTYGQVRYREIYPGVDVLFYGNQQQLEYDFIVSPGARPEQIRLGFRGATALNIDARGDLVLQLPGGGALRQPRPVLYQEVAGTRHEVTGGYVRRAGTEVGFKVGAYDPHLPLVIDPVLVYSTYLNFFADAQNGGLTLDAANNVYLTGSDGSNAYVAKLRADGTGFLYTTVIGGGRGDTGLDIKVDGAGNAYVSGNAYSLNFPVVNAFQAVKASEAINVADVFVLKLDAGGANLIFSTFLGGKDDDENFGLALDAAGNAYVTGYTQSPIHYVNAPPGAPFPTVNAFQPELAGPYDGFLTKFTAAGAVVYSTYLGGTGGDYVLDVAVDDQGSPYLVGSTDSTDFPRQNPLQSAARGSNDVFITKFNPTGSALVYSTYLGGTGSDVPLGVALDAGKNLYLTGYTYSTDFPRQNPLQATNGGGADVFVTKLDAAGAALIYSTYVGGARGELGADIALTPDGAAYVTGYSSSSNFPTANPIQPNNAGGVDAILFKLNSTGAALSYSTYLGGSNSDYGQGVVVDATDRAIMLGTTYSSNYPTVNSLGGTPNTNLGGAFLTKVSEAGNQTIYKISGRIESNVGNPLSGVTLTLSGTQTGTTQTSSSLYSFTGLAAGGTYTITPSAQGLTFDPPSVTFTNLQSDQTADFMQAPRSYHINGRITNAQGVGLPNITVDIGGYYYPIERYTDAQGYFGIMYLEGGRTYTVTPRSNVYAFTPGSYTYQNINSNQTPTFTAIGNTNLSVSLTSPAAGATFQAPATINLSANATSSGSSINRVEFYANANLIGTDTSAPYSFDWPNVAGGSYSLSAVVVDNAGASKQSSAASILVNSVSGPVVQLTNPANGATLTSGGYIYLSANATSAGGEISKVEFYEGTRLLGTDTTGPGPYTYIYFLYAGDYTLTAVAYDTAGAVTRSAPVQLSVRDNQFPTVSLPLPAGGPTFPSGANITLTANANDPDGTVQKVVFYANSTVVGMVTAPPFTVNWNNVPDGSYTLVAAATDDRGATSFSNYRDIRVGNSLPTVTLTSPSSAAQYGAPAAISMTANAFDSDGTITQVEFLAAGQVVGLDTTAPYGVTWNNVPAGDYDLVARATDDAGAVAYSTHILVRVFAELPQISITRPTNNASFVAPANIVLESNVTSTVGVTSVWYYANGRNIGIVNGGAPYSLTWSGVTAGTYTITAEAWDRNSAKGYSAPLNITVTGASWEVQLPRVTGLDTETIQSVSMISPTDGWAVGAAGVIVRTSDGGQTWVRQNSGTTDPLNAVYFKDGLHGWAAGNNMLYTVDGGQTWQQSNWSRDTVYSLTCADLNTCFAGRGESYLHKTTDGGRNWVVVSMPISVGGVQFFDAQNGVASGAGGVLRTTDGGQTWSVWARTHGGYFVNFNQGWYLSGNTAERTVDGGLTWQPLTLPTGSWVYNYYFLDTQNGWGVGSQENIIHTTDGGQTWTTQRPATFTAPLWGVRFNDAQHGIAVGNSGTALSTADGGLTWTRSARAFNPQVVNHMAATDLNHAWAASNNGEIIYTGNGGVTWSPALLTPAATGNMVGIDFVDNANGWAVARVGYTGPSSIYRSTDGGQTWQRSNAAPTTDGLYGIAALDAQTAVAVGSTGNNGIVRRTEDGGQTWTTGTLPAGTRQLAAVDFINATTGWACGFSGTVVKTTDGGKTWTTQSFSADSLDSISFADANNGWASGYGYYYYHTTNGGQSWTAANNNGAFIIYGIQTINATTAWMVGDGWYGRTVNGGATWTRESTDSLPFYRALAFVDADNGWVGASASGGKIYRRRGAVNPNAPRATITAPTDGAAFPAGSGLSIDVAASSPNGTAIASVDFYINNQLYATDRTAPYSVPWNNIPANVYVLTAVVTDMVGAQGTSAPVRVTSQLPVEPTVYLSSPVNGTTFPAPANITVSAYANAANSSRYITRIEFYAGPNLIGTAATTPYNVTWNNVPAGIYTLTAKAFDNLGAQGQSSPVTIDVGNTSGNAPTVSITSPVAGATFTAPTDILVTAAASDANSTVTKVDFFADARLLGTDTTAPYSITWPQVAAGTYNITARATNSTGQTGASNPVAITVNGPPPPNVSVTGHVTSPTGRALANITITLSGAGAGTTTTDADGNYTFGNLPAGGNYTLAPSFTQGSFVFDPGQHNLINLQTDRTCNFVGTNLNGDEGDTRALVISEFRFSGPAGALDEFIEFYNNSGRELTVQTGDGSAGWALVGSDGIVRFVIPAGTVIPARGHLLATNSAYSLAAYAPGDLQYTTDIPDNAGIALFLTAEPAYLTRATRFDAFGFGAVTNSLYREGFSVSLAADAPVANASYVRRTVNGVIQDTDENGSDFDLLAPGRILGPAGPENLASPVLNNVGLKPSLIDTQALSTSPPNRVRDQVPVPNGQYGTLAIRRRFTNRTGQLVTALRFRVIDITTQGTPNTCGGCTLADMRVLTSGDTSATITNGSTVTIRGTVLEQAADQPNGGGLNSAVAVPLPGGALAPGAAVNVQFLLGVQQNGTYRFFINVEAATGQPGANAAKGSGAKGSTDNQR